MTSTGLYPQVDVDYNEEMQKTIHDGKYRPASNHPLNAMDIISNIWEQPPDRHLHVFVGRPGDVGRRPSDADTQSGEFFGLLASAQLAKEIISFVFAMPAVTGLKRARDEYTSDNGDWYDGWRRLGPKHPWKRFGDYWRKQSVETTSNSLSITLAYEEKGEEDPEYRLQLSPPTGNKIIVRACYKSLYDRILQLRQDENEKGFVLTGQPGTGASFIATTRHVTLTVIPTTRKDAVVIIRARSPTH